MKRMRDEEEYEVFQVQIQKQNLISCTVNYIEEDKKIFHYFRWHDLEVEHALEEWHTFVDFVNDVMRYDIEDELERTNNLLSILHQQYKIDYKKLEDDDYDRRVRLLYCVEDEGHVYDQEIPRVYHWEIPLKIKHSP